MPISASATPWVRAGIGLLQGLALFALTQASEQHVWPATDGLLFAPLLTLAIFVPLLVISGLGNLRWRTLVPWLVVAAVVCAGCAAYDIYRHQIPPGSIAGVPLTALILPSGVVWLSLAAILFIVHTMIVSGEAERKFIASYPIHFDTSWKHGVQLVLALLFVGLFWGLLFLGAELFRLVRIEFFAEFIRRKAFWIPVTTLTFGYALHVTDTRANIVQGARTLTLILLSWLLPVMAGIGAAFIVALIFTGLEPLWSTHRATAILLTAAAALVFLINAAYQDGRPEHRAVAVLRYASVLAAVVLLALVALATYGVALRIQQYGLTPERVGAAACVVVAACYAIGYVVAVARSGVGLRGLEPTNVVTSLVIVAVLILLCSPIADPDRIVVVDQVHRLETGQISPAQFDFAFLRFRAGRYGIEALQRLVEHPEGLEANDIADRARKTLAALYPSNLPVPPPRLFGPEQRAANITVVQPSGTLPEQFLQQDWAAIQRLHFELPRCLVAVTQCDAFMADLDGDGQPEILLFDPLVPGNSGAFKAGPDNKWEFIGTFTRTACPPRLRDALKPGRLAVVEPSLKDIEVGGVRLRLIMPWCEITPKAPASR
jgi:Domain of unknown function (DUF4153)